MCVISRGPLSFGFALGPPAIYAAEPTWTMGILLLPAPCGYAVCLDVQCSSWWADMRPVVPIASVATEQDTVAVAGVIRGIFSESIRRLGDKRFHALPRHVVD